jgi:teichuronic acid biosynthesis glycosyltransferase TuaC
LVRSKLLSFSADKVLGTGLRKRILVIANDFPDEQHPHAGIFILRQVEALTRASWEAMIVRFVPWAPPLGHRWRTYRRVPAQYTINGLQVKVVRVFLLPRFWLMHTLGLQTKRFLSACIAEFRPQILHAHQILPTGVMALGHGVPVVLTAHGSDAYDYPFRNGLFRATAQRILHSVDRVVAVSKFIAVKVEALGARRVDVIYNGADPDLFFPRDRSDARRTLDIPSSRKVVLFAGYVGRSKGIFDLVAALDLLSDLSPLLLLAGGGPDRDAVVRECARTGIECRAFGIVEQRQLGLLMGAADVLALPSYREGLPAVLCEAMLAELPVVASCVGGIPEIVKDGHTGRLVEPGNIGTLARALREVLCDPVGASRLGRAARTFAAGHLTWPENASSYDRLLTSLLEPVSALQESASNSNR